MSFSKRKGLIPAEVPLQINAMDDGLRNGLWSKIFTVLLESDKVYLYQHPHNNLLRSIWCDFYKLPVDEIPEYIRKFVAHCKQKFYNYEWNVVYDFIEFILEKMATSSRSKFAELLSNLLNDVLERDNSAYRIVNYDVVDIVDPITVDSISKSISQEVFQVPENI